MISAFTAENLLTLSETGPLPAAAAAIGDKIFAALDRGTPLHDRVVSQRGAHRAAHPLPPGGAEPVELENPGEP